MTAKQKKFILTKLIPFILREEGRGFVMKYWRTHTDNNWFYHPDLEASVTPPKCGTVCCIGGSIEYLNGKKEPQICGDFATTGAMIGLSGPQSNALFDSDIEWPEVFAKRFSDAKTPLGKAKSAAALLREVVRTNGKCLDAS